MADIKNFDNTYVANTYARFPLQIVSGKGAIAYDETGKRYIDLGSGIAVNSFGFADEVWQEAVTAQVKTLQHTSNLYYTEPCVQLAKQLCERTGLCRVFFSNSGAEANECAIKTARRYSFLKYGEGRHVIITLKNSFHGRTITTLAATGQDSFHTEFGPFTEGFRYATVGDIDELKAMASAGDVAAIMIETVQGEGGVLELPADYIAAIKAITEEQDILLIVDEVQTGNGRTGKLYSYMHHDLHPDIVSTAKGLAGGLPLGATMLGERVKDTLTPGSHGSTFGGNPVCCAGALSVLNRLTDDFLSDVTKKSDYIKAELEGAPGVVGVSGRGLMLGIETVRPAKEIIADCMAAGVLVLSAKTKVRLLPPLSISMEELAEAIAVLKEALAK
ncbi:MAG: aspartate aminotransferase family protein [Ruminococcaceae bacterium]|nr:aspartate aminotransferase family protein [Oscillospiraceae bacterium]